MRFSFESSLRKDALAYGAATLAERATSFLLLPLLTKTLTPELYGVWSQIVVSAAFAGNLVLLGLHTAAVRFLAGAVQPREQSAIVHRMLGIVAVNAAIVIGVTWLIPAAVSELVFGDPGFTGFVRLLGVFWAQEAVFELITAVLRARRRIARLSVYYFVKNGIRVVILAGALIGLRTTLLQAVWLLLAVQCVLLAFLYGFEIWRVLGLALSLGETPWAAVLAFALPLVPYNMLTWANNFLDRCIVVHLLDLRRMSVYAVAYSLAAIVGLLYSVLGFVLYPYLVERWNEGDRDAAAQALHRTTQSYLILFVPFLTMLAMLSTPITRVFATEAYVANPLVVLLLGIGIGLFGLYQLNLYTTLLAGKMGANFVVLIVATLVNVLLNLVMIPRLGILGAAIATVASNAILAVSTIVISRKALPYAFCWGMVGRTVLAGAGMGGFLFLARSFLDTSQLAILAIVVAIAFAIYASLGFLTRAVAGGL